MIWINGGLGEELERSGRNGGELDWPSWFFTFQKKYRQEIFRTGERGKV